MLWYRELGFNTNPFSIKPAPFDFKIIGYDLKEIFEKIAKGEVLFIEGKYGYGKTTTLKSIINEFGGSRDVVYYSTNRPDKDMDVDGLLYGKYGALGRIFNVMPKNMILLLDEVESLTQKDQNDLLKFYRQGNIKSFVFFGSNFEKVGFNIELKKLMINNVIQLTKLTQEEAVELVRQRVGNIKLLSDNTIKKVYTLSEYNPRQLLENLEDLCKYAVENNDDEVVEEHLKEVLRVREKKPRKKRKKQKQASKKHEANEDIFVEEIKKPEEITPRPAFPKKTEESEEKEEAEYFY